MNVPTAYSSCSLASFCSSFRHTSLCPSFGELSCINMMSPYHRHKFYFINHLPSKGIACTHQVSNSGRKSGACLVHVASSSWVQQFISRHGLAIRYKTTESQKDPEKLVDKLTGYILQICRQWGKIAYHDKDVIVMDETAVWQDMVSNTTVDNIGESTSRVP